MHGADTELDRQVLERIKDPLTHMVRNSADHGLESRAERIAAGKPEKGTIRLSAYHEGGHIIIGVADDGRGLDTERIRDKALANGLVDRGRARQDVGAADPEVHLHARLLHRQPRSPACPAAASAWTWCATTSIRSAAASTCSRCSGQGLSFTIKIPLTLAIISALIVEAGGERFAIPQLSVVELVRVHAKSEHRIERIKDAAVLRLRNKLLPLVRLSSLLQARRRPGDARQGLHRRDAGRRPDLRRRGRRRVPHRGNRGQADGDQAAPHRHVLRQHHSRRRLGDHDRRSERRVAGDRRRRSPRPPRPTRDSEAEQPRRGRKHACRCWCSAPARRSRRRCRCRSSRGWKRSIAARSSSRTAATWCSTAASSCRWCASATRSRSSAKARSRCWCSPTAAARWASWSTRSSTSSRTSSTSRSAATGPACSARR